MQLIAEQLADGWRFYQLEADSDVVFSRNLRILLDQLAARPYVVAVEPIHGERLPNGGYAISFAAYPRNGKTVGWVDKQILHRLRSFFLDPEIALVVQPVTAAVA